MLKKHSKRAVKAIKAPALLYLPTENTLTDLIGDLYVGLDVVSRELVGAIPSVTRNASAERAAVGQNITWHVAPPAVAEDIVPAMTIPNPADVTFGAGKMTITKARAVPIGWVGKEQRALNVAGSGYLNLQADYFAQALRTLTNEMEADVLAELTLKASRAYGTPGNVPFATNLGDVAQMRKLLDDNGAPATERSGIIDTTAGASMRTLANLTKANEAGTTMTLRDGELLNVHNISFKESAQVRSPVVGTGAGATTNAAGYAVGVRVITLAAAGTGTILAGDIITFAGDTNKYVVTAGNADVSAGGAITLAAPGLRKAVPGAATAITIVGSGSRMPFFPRSAMQLACRAPELPVEGDAAVDSFMLIDPRSGIAFEVRVYVVYRRVRLEVGAAWGVMASKTEHIALLLG